MSVQFQSGSPSAASQSQKSPSTAPAQQSSASVAQVAVDQFLRGGHGDLLSVLKGTAASQGARTVRKSWFSRLIERARIRRTATGQLTSTEKKRKKRGLFKKIGGFFKKVGRGIGNALKKVGKFFLKFGPIIFGVMCLIPGLNVVGMVGLAAIAAYKAIKEKDILGAVLTIAGAVTGGAAGALGSAASTAMQVASKVAQYARMAQQAVKAIQAAQNGNWLGAIAGMAGAVAGGVGTGAEKLASTLEQVETWAKRAETASRAWGVAKNGDVLGAIGIGASLAGDISKNDEVKDAFAKVAKGAQGAKGVQAALEGNDYMAAASILAQTGGQLTEGKDQELFKKAATSIQAVSIASQAIEQKDWSRAGAVLVAGSGSWVGSDETRGKLLVASKALDTAGKAFKAADKGYYLEAAVLLGQSINFWQSLETDGESEVRKEWSEAKAQLESSSDTGMMTQQAA